MHLWTAVFGRGEQKTNVLRCHVMPVRSCEVSFQDARGIRHTAQVEAESLYEAAVLGIRRFREDPWLEVVGPGTVLDIEAREPGTKHALKMMLMKS
jgi:hypothetical protein